MPLRSSQAVMGINDLPRQPLLLLALCMLTYQHLPPICFCLEIIRRERDVHSHIFVTDNEEIVSRPTSVTTELYAMLRNATNVSAVIEDCFIPKIEISSV